MIIELTDSYLNNIYSLDAMSYDVDCTKDRVWFIFHPVKDNIWKSYVNTHPSQKQHNIIEMDSRLVELPFDMNTISKNLSLDFIFRVFKIEVKKIECSVKKITENGKRRFIVTVDKIDIY